jgi:hypothetical protein
LKMAGTYNDSTHPILSLALKRDARSAADTAGMSDAADTSLLRLAIIRL